MTQDAIRLHQPSRFALVLGDLLAWTAWQSGRFTSRARNTANPRAYYGRERTRGFGLAGQEIVRVSEAKVHVGSEAAGESSTTFGCSPDGRWDSFYGERRGRFLLRQDLAGVLDDVGLILFRWTVRIADGLIAVETGYVFTVCWQEKSAA